jgi:Fe-S cluster assembly scaffold protein SufB
LPYDDLIWASSRQAVPTIPFGPAGSEDPEIDRPALATQSAGGLVHLAAMLLEAPGKTTANPRVIVRSLADARHEHTELLLPVMHKIVDPHQDRFAALATAFQNCGAFVYVPDGVVLDAPIQLLFVNSEAAAAALFFTGSTQHVDLTIHTDHSVGQTTSNTIVRSAATDHGQGRFFGNIAIRKHSHGSDAALRDDALLLSKTAHIDSVPALEIAANDVKAFHGATVGSVDDEQLFYARSRGISRADALRMIALGFFEPVVSQFPGEPLRDEIRTALDQKIDTATELD